MTMTLDPNSQRFGSINYGHMSSYPSSQPQFTNPWAAQASSGVGAQNGGHSIYGSSSQGGLNPNPLSLDSLTKHHHHQPAQPQHVSRSSAGSADSMSSYGSIPVTSASAGSPHSMAHVVSLGGPQGLLSPPQDLLSLGRMTPTVNSVPTSAGYADAPYTSSASPIHPTYAATSQASYESIGRYAPATMQPAFNLASDADHGARRYSQQSVLPFSPLFSVASISLLLVSARQGWADGDHPRAVTREGMLAKRAESC